MCEFLSFWPSQTNTGVPERASDQHKERFQLQFIVDLMLESVFLLACVRSKDLTNYSQCTANAKLFLPSIRLKLYQQHRGTEELMCRFLWAVLDMQMSLCQACLPVLKNKWCQIKPKDGRVGDEVLLIQFTILCCNIGRIGPLCRPWSDLLCLFMQINIDKLEKCITELVKHVFNNDTEALNARILVCIFWGLLRVQSSYIKQSSMVMQLLTSKIFIFFLMNSDYFEHRPQSIFLCRLMMVEIHCLMICFSSSSHHLEKSSFRSIYSI